MKEKIGEVVAEVAKSSPPLGVVGLTIMGYPISDWVQVAVLLYTVLQAHVLANKNINWYKSFIKWLTKGGVDGSSIKRK